MSKDKMNPIIVPMRVIVSLYVKMLVNLRSVLFSWHHGSDSAYELEWKEVYRASQKLEELLYVLEGKMLEEEQKEESK